MASMKSFQYKLVLLGESAVGKSSIVYRFVKDQFQENQESTIGAAFLTQTLVVEDATVKLEIWDTAGQERYHSLAPMYYRGAHAAIIVYDLTSKESFHRARVWVRELSEKAASIAVTALVGNKLDLEEQRDVSTEEAKLFAEEQGLIFMETSAKAAINIQEIFMEIAKKLPKDTINSTKAIPSGRTGHRLNESSSGGAANNCGCNL